MRWLVLIATLSSVGCGTELNYVRTHKAPHRMQARAAEAVEIFMASGPARPYVAVGLLESQQRVMSTDDAEDIIAEMREYAGERGCDGLVIFAGNDASSDVGSGGFVTTLKGYRASCIVYVSAKPLAVTQAAAAATCVPNATQLCYGPGGCRGAQSCAADGRTFTVCDCGTDQQPTAAASR